MSLLKVVGLAGDTDLTVNTDELNVVFKDDDYMLYQSDNGELYEYIDGSGVLISTTVWGLLRRTFSDSLDRYSNMEGWIPTLKELQRNSPSIVDKLITECKSYDQTEFKNWIVMRSNDELEELVNFGNIIYNFSKNEL